MTVTENIQFQPAPGSRKLMFRGDTAEFNLLLNEPWNGAAFLRTNLGHAAISRTEIIHNVLYDKAPLGRDWFDIPMARVDEKCFRVTLPLCQEGHFEAKGFFVAEANGELFWPPGDNVSINVEPADTCCANILYNAFVRQFGPNRSGGFFENMPQDAIDVLDRSGYAVIPPSGTFRDLIAELDFIINRLGCRLIQLLPVHPTPTTYARMGRFGSPYAALTFRSVDPALAEFDPKATPLEQFVELVDAVHFRNARLIIDIAINHTGWAASLHESHPDWLVRDDTGEIKVPGAWGVRWEDLTKLDYSHKDLWHYMSDVYLTWCRRGVDGFRCDAGYMIPVEAWQYIIARVREQFPRTIFFLEGLGGKISVMRELLNRANFNWAYSELFQNYDHVQIEAYLPEADAISRTEGVLVHYAETHDNPRLASRSNTWAGMRTALSALCSQQGAFGFANGVEWYAREKINVHESTSIDWGASPNQVEEIRRLTFLLKNHPAFFSHTDLRLFKQKENTLALLRVHQPTGKTLLILANLDDQKHNSVTWDSGDFAAGDDTLLDLLTGRMIKTVSSGRQICLQMNPGQVFCLSADPADRELVEKKLAENGLLPEYVLHQQLRAKVLDVIRFYHQDRDLKGFDVDQAARELKKDPLTFCKAHCPKNAESGIIRWQWPRDTVREVMIPPGFFLLVQSDAPFRARIEEKRRVLAYEESLPVENGHFFALFSPLPVPPAHRPVALKLSVFLNGRCDHLKAPLLLLTHARNVRPKKVYSRRDILADDLSFLITNERSSAIQCPLTWGRLNSRYDALFCASLHPDFPVNRRIMLARCRIWLVYQDFSQEIGNECIDSFVLDSEGRGIWHFRVPTGQGNHVKIAIMIDLTPGDNVFLMTLSRLAAGSRGKCLKDDFPIQLILRPDIENRSFHETTKAYLGPEQTWPDIVEKQADGFIFRPDSDHMLDVRMTQAEFFPEPEWQYMVHRIKEKERGLDPDSDLFSPGYFRVPLKGKAKTVLSAVMTAGSKSTSTDRNAVAAARQVQTPAAVGKDKWLGALKENMNRFVVRRSEYRTVIAGYPWFLDWGRDALIFVRGVIAAGQFETARSIIRQFGQFEENGTLPNMIVGSNAENRDTSDAPLWLVTACADLASAEGNSAFLTEKCGNRTMAEILVSIGKAFVGGTANGIRMDPDSGLVFSPSHFTWMDTNHPAGTPREGYPIEIQGLWFAALQFIGTFDADANIDWRGLSLRVQTSVEKLFYLPEQGYFSDCLHAPSGKSAFQAEPDDALRPNQLLAVTLGAIKDIELCRNTIAACEELIVPGAIRSLADRPVERPLAIVHQGRTINNPMHPYQGRYEGDEDTRRKPAYHNGTAWTWMFPLFCEAWAKVYGPRGKAAALAWLSGATRLLNPGCVGHMPEIVDGNYPHKQRGCEAQAWGISELVRVWQNLEKL